MTSSRTRRLTSAAAVAALAATGVASTSGTSSAAKNGPTIDVQLLSFNDFHGNLEPPAGSGGRHHRRPLRRHARTPTGDGNRPTCSTARSTPVASSTSPPTSPSLRQGHPNSLTVAAGDLVGASPLLSAAFHDEPTIEAMNSRRPRRHVRGQPRVRRGLQGAAAPRRRRLHRRRRRREQPELLPRRQRSRAPTSRSSPPTSSTRAPNKTILPPYSVKNVKGAKIGFIGMTLEDTPNIVTASGVEGLDFTDEVATANALVPVLKKQGVNAIVVLIHQGGFPRPADLDRPGRQGPTRSTPTTTSPATRAAQLVRPSPIIADRQGLDPAIDMVVSGHTHQPYVCNIPDPAGQQRLVTSASSFGRLVTETTLDYDRRTHGHRPHRPSRAPTSSSPATSPRTPAQTALIDQYQHLVAPIANRVLGTITADVGRSTPRTRQRQRRRGVGARRPHRRRPAGRPVGRHRWQTPADRLHEPRRHPGADLTYARARARATGSSPTRRRSRSSRSTTTSSR